jgi:hypothetical protein
VNEPKFIDPETVWSCSKFTRAFARPHLWQGADSARSLNLVPKLPRMNYPTHRRDFVAVARGGYWARRGPAALAGTSPLTGVLRKDIINQRLTACDPERTFAKSGRMPANFVQGQIFEKGFRSARYHYL